jgi:hypothetical protein
VVNGYICGIISVYSKVNIKYSSLVSHRSLTIINYCLRSVRKNDKW